VVLTNEDLLWFVDRALDQMLEIVQELGDDLANRQPALEGANSPFSIVTHCVGVMDYWSGHVMAGRTVHRDRAAELQAKGTFQNLKENVVAVRTRFGQDLGMMNPADPPRNPPEQRFGDVPYAERQGAVVIHVYQELAQHLGQMEITRDLLLAQ
jgi:hypothetical protein